MKVRNDSNVFFILNSPFKNFGERDECKTVRVELCKM